MDFTIDVRLKHPKSSIRAKPKQGCEANPLYILIFYEVYLIVLYVGSRVANATPIQFLSEMAASIRGNSISLEKKTHVIDLP